MHQIDHSFSKYISNIYEIGRNAISFSIVKFIINRREGLAKIIINPTRSIIKQTIGETD